jgi:hypothetical protein
MLNSPVHIAIQVVMLFAQIVIPTIPGFPHEWQSTVAAFVSFLQAVLAVFAHYRTPQGDKIAKPE